MKHIGYAAWSIVNGQGAYFAQWRLSLNLNIHEQCRLRGLDPSHARNAVGRLTTSGGRSAVCGRFPGVVVAWKRSLRDI